MFVDSTPGAWSSAALCQQNTTICSSKMVVLLLTPSSIDTGLLSGHWSCASKLQQDSCAAVDAEQH